MINKDYFIDMFIVRSSLLSATFLFTFLLSSSQAQETTSKVLYAGITIEGVESWMAEEFEKKFEDIFIDRSFEVMRVIEPFIFYIVKSFGMPVIKVVFEEFFWYDKCCPQKH